MSLRARIANYEEDEWKKWLRKDLLHFPRIQPLLAEEKKYHRKLYLNLLNEYNDKKRAEEENLIKRLDRDWNLNRILSRDEKYLNIGRNKPKSNFFSHSIMNRIALDASKTVKNKNKYTKSTEKFSINFQDETPCPRYVRNLKRFDNREYYKLLAASSEMDQLLVDESTFSLPAIGSNKEVNFENDLKAESLVLPNIQSDFGARENDKQNNRSNVLNQENNSINTNQNQVNLPPIDNKPQIGLLKPKYQLAGFNIKKIQ